MSHAHPVLAALAISRVVVFLVLFVAVMTFSVYTATQAVLAERFAAGRAAGWQEAKQTVDKIIAQQNAP